MTHTVILYHYIPGPHGRRQRQLARLTGTLEELTYQIQAYCPQVSSAEIRRALVNCPWFLTAAINWDYSLMYSHLKDETLKLREEIKPWHLENQPN